MLCHWANDEWASTVIAVAPEPDRGHAPFGNDAYIYFVGVKRDARGQRIAPALLSVLAARAIADGFRCLKIDNMDSNVSALRVNEQLGFFRKPGRIELRSVYDD